MTELMSGIGQRRVPTDRVAVNVLEHAGAGAAGAEGAESGGDVPVVFVHGNCSSSLFWQPTMQALGSVGRRSLAIDLRGFGESEIAPVDATRGLRDFSDDVAATLDALEVSRAHLVGWSMGGGVVQQLLIDRPDLVESLTLVAPVSPYGFGGTAADGSLLTPDGAGTGGGGANPEFVKRLGAKDRSEESGSSPRKVFRAVYVAPGFDDGHEDLWTESTVSTAVGEDNYPGDLRPSQNWPGFAPGDRGVLNTMAPTHCNLTGIVEGEAKPPILWIRGDVDAIISDASSLDLNRLGELGVIPGWPGAEVAPAQPMIAQTRAVLDRYRDAGGAYREVVLTGVGHSPHLEQPEAFRVELLEHIR